MRSLVRGSRPDREACAETVLTAVSSTVVCALDLCARFLCALFLRVRCNTVYFGKKSFLNKLYLCQKPPKEKSGLIYSIDTPLLHKTGCPRSSRRGTCTVNIGSYLRAWAPSLGPLLLQRRARRPDRPQRVLVGIRHLVYLCVRWGVARA